MKLHTLKIDYDALDLKMRGVKNWEIRYDDRNYNVGDVLCEREFDINTNEYGKMCTVEKVVSILPRKFDFCLKEGFKILITQPLYYGEYEDIEDLISYGDNCFLLIKAIAKMFGYEDYIVWGNQSRYNWKAVAEFVLYGKSLDSVYKEVLKA